MSTIRGRYPRMLDWLNGAIRMLCAIRHSGSSVSDRNRPVDPVPRAATSPGPSCLSNRSSSQISGIRSAPDTMIRVVPGTTSL